MEPQLEKARITEIQVRMDCNGCVQKIKKALHGINGIHTLYIDFPQQKLTVVGWADPEEIMKAIKKTRKVATICSHIDPNEPPAQSTEPAPEGGPPAPDAAANPPPPTESQPAEAAPPTEPPKDPPPPENPAPEMTPSPIAAETAAPQLVHPSGPRDVEEIHVIHHHPPDYNYGYNHGGHWNNHPNGHGFQPEPPVYVTHSYNTYKPSPYISEYQYIQSPPRHTRFSRMDHYSEVHPHRSTSDGYISEYQYIRPPPQQTHYSRMEHYSEDQPTRSNGDGNNITSMFSDENPNACRIV